MGLTRRHFVALMGTAAANATSAVAQAVADQSVSTDKSVALTVIAYNIYECKGWPDGRTLATKAKDQLQMARRLAMELALYQPDIIHFSESPSESLVAEVAGYLEMNHVRFPSGGKWPGSLLSRYPINNVQNVPLGYPRPQELFTRHWGQATVMLPSGEALLVHAAHLFPGDDPTHRVSEVKAMLGSMKADLAAGRSMLLLGDLNHGPATEEHRLWLDAGWVDTFLAVGEGEGLTIKSDAPAYRIDYVMAAGPLAKQVVESRPLFEGAFRVNMPDSAGFALSDHLPQLARFQIK